MKPNPILLLLISLTLLAGCSRSAGPTLVEAGGTILVNGAPLADARLEFVKTDTGALSFAQTDEQGRFALRHSHGRMGAEPGRYRVAVYQPGKLLPVPKDWQPQSPDEGPPRGEEKPLKMSDGSPVEVEVTASGPNEFEIDFR